MPCIIRYLYNLHNNSNKAKLFLHNYSVFDKMSRIVGLNDLKKKNESKEDKKQEQLFAGGLDQRGLVGVQD